MWFWKENPPPYSEPIRNNNKFYFVFQKYFEATRLCAKFQQIKKKQKLSQLLNIDLGNFFPEIFRTFLFKYFDLFFRLVFSK